MPLNLAAHGYTLGLTPEHGGGVFRLSKGNVDILRKSSAGEADPTALSAFPMVPFSGRIDLGKFAWDGTGHALAANFPPEPHAIHGFGWQAPWSVVRNSVSSALLRYRCRGTAWPWSFDATQAFSLHPWGLRLTIAIHNRSPVIMPAGLGWHPYFPSRNAMIQCVTETIIRNGPDMIPLAREPVSVENDLRRPRRVEGLDLDNAYGVAAAGVQRFPQEPDARLHVLSWPDRTVTLRCSSALSTVVVYSPPGKGFFCVEPATHPPDAINTEPSTLHRLPPGETLTVHIELAVSEPGAVPQPSG